jgi:ribosome-associated protein
MLIETILKELQFKAVRSGGPGGQHVNKSSSKVEVSFDLNSSEGLTHAEKVLLLSKLGTRISAQGILTLQCSDNRSQHRNKKIGIERMIELLQNNLRVPKPRKKSKPSKNAIEKRLQSKKKQALKKGYRKPPQIE